MVFNFNNILVLVLISMMSFSLVACSNNNNNTDSGSDVFDMTQKELDNAYQDLFYDNETMPSIGELKKELSLMQKKDSFNKIDEQLELGELDETQANTLRIIAGYSPESLPNSYKSDFEETAKTGRSSLQEAKIWLTKNFDSLDEETQELLYPYHVAPNHPDSYLNKASNAQKIVDAVSVIPGAEAAEAAETWKEKSFSKGWINYKQDSESSQATWVKDAFLYSYSKYKTLLGVELDTDAYVYIKSMSDYGSADLVEYNDNKKHCEIEVRTGLSEKVTKSSIAHELFHCFQFMIPLEYSPKDRQWLMEATATWSENFVYPSYNSEHEYLKGFFYYLDQKMIHYGSNREYSTYMWPLFLTQYNNNDAIIKTILNDAKTDSTKAATTNIPNFDNRFSDYGIWNWNKRIAKLYKDTPGIPGNPMWKPAHDHHYYSKGDVENKFINLMPLSLNYDTATFKDEVKKVVYKFEKEGDKKHQRWVLLNINGVWHVEDWTNVLEKTFCRNRDYEYVKGIVLISDNSDLNNDYENSFEISTESECEPIWHGSMTLTWDHSEQGTAQTLGGDTAKSKVQTKGHVVIQDELMIDEDGDANIVKTQITYNGYQLQRVDYDRDCSYLWEYDEDVKTGSLIQDYTGEKYGPRRWTLNDYPEDATGIEFDLYLRGDDWYTISNTKAYMLKSCGFGLGYGATEGLHEDKLELKSGILDFDSFEYIFPEDWDNERIQGTYEIPFYSDEWGNYDIHVEFDYQYS